MFMDSTEFSKTHFTESPKVLYSVNMVVSVRKFIFAMFDPIMLFVPVVHEPVVGSETVGIYDRIGVGLALNNGQQLTDRAVFDNLGVNFIATLEHPENGDFTFGSTPANPAYPPRSEKALIELDLAVYERALSCAKLAIRTRSLS